jgi:hypothetical protein
MGDLNVEERHASSRRDIGRCITALSMNARRGRDRNAQEASSEDTVMSIFTLRSAPVVLRNVHLAQACFVFEATQREICATPPKAVTKVSDSTKSGTYEAVRWERCRVKYLVSEVDVSGCRRRFERLLDVRNRLLQAYSRI